MAKNKKIASIAAVFIAAILAVTPMSNVFAEQSRPGEDVRFDAGGGGGGTTGESNSDNQTSIGGSDSATEATETKNNRLSQNYIRDMIRGSGDGLTDGFVINGNGQYVIIENFTEKWDWLKRIIDQANFTDGFSYNKIDTSDMTPKLPGGFDAGAMDVFNKIVQGKIGSEGKSLSEGGTQLGAGVNPLNNFNWDDLNLTTGWPGWGGPMKGLDLWVFKEWLMENGGYHIPGKGQDGLIDFPTNKDRYRYLDAYLSYTANTDTLNVQHIVEYKIEQVHKSVVYQSTPIPYDHGGLYSWGVERIDGADNASNENRQHYNIHASGDSVLYYRFNVPGTYNIFAKQQLQPSKVDAVQYSMNEYWVLADTGQVIYKRISNGKVGAIDKESGRSEDKNIAYYNMEIGPPLQDYDGSGMLGVKVYQTDWEVTSDMLEGQFPAAGTFNNYSTRRIE